MAMKGNKYGIHRVIEPQGVLTQAAYKIDNDMTKLYSNEIMCDVISLNIDSASFTQISEACGGDEKKIGEMILGIVAERGKQQNPVTGSGGMFIGKASIITGDPTEPDNFDKMNVGTYRIQVKGANRIGMQCLAMHDIAKQLAEAEKKNEKFPICVTLGNAPLVTFMASTPVGYTQNEYEFVGALNNGVPADIVKSDLYDHLYVPAGAEVVLEGYIDPRVRTCEGPFGEFPGSYSGCRAQCEAVITHVTYRTNPIFENIYLGMPWTEIDFLMALNTSVPIYKQLHDEGFPEVVSVNAMYTHGMNEIISMKPRYGGQAATAAFRIMSTPHGAQYAHNVIIVDDFVDPFDLNQVMWALSTRVRPDKDVKVIPNCPGMTLNPTEEIPGITAKLVIDATTPIDPEPVTREVEMLGDPAETADYAKLLAELWAVKNK